MADIEKNQVEEEVVYDEKQIQVLEGLADGSRKCRHSAFRRS